MIRKMMLFAVVPLMISMLAPTGSAQPAAKKKGDEKKKDNIKLEVLSVTKNDAQAKQIIAEKKRIVPVAFQWLCGSEGNAKLVELEAVLDTVNTDGTKSQVSKKLVDWTVNKPIDSQIDLPMPDGVFARDFTLTLKGKFQRELVRELVNVGAVKTGNFPVPAAK